MKKNTQYAELFELYVNEKIKREEIENRYNALVKLLKEDGGDRVSNRIHDELEAQKRLH